jgi:ATP-dependent Clp protease ATP-binding subunit ClpA
MVRTFNHTQPLRRATGLATLERRRLGHQYLGPEHLLLGLLLQGDNLAARVLVAHGLDVETVRAGIDRLIAQRLLPGPQPSDAEMLAGIGIDVEEVAGHLKETFGAEAYREATYRVAQRAAQPAIHQLAGSPPPMIGMRAMRFAVGEAVARGREEIGPEHLLLGLLAEAEQPLETEMDPLERRLRIRFGLPDHGAHPVKLLVEARGLTLEELREALLAELDRDGG